MRVLQREMDLGIHSLDEIFSELVWGKENIVLRVQTGTLES